MFFSPVPATAFEQREIVVFDLNGIGSFTQKKKKLLSVKIVSSLVLMKKLKLRFKFEKNYLPSNLITGKMQSKNLKHTRSAGHEKAAADFASLLNAMPRKQDAMSLQLN